MNYPSRILRSPLTHFLLLGLAIFAVQLWRSQANEPPPEARSFTISIDAARVAELKDGFHRQTGRPPSERELGAMVSAAVDEEILYRESVAMGFLEQDAGIQSRLIQKMLFLESNAKLEDANALLTRAISLGLYRDDIVVRRILVQKMRLFASRLAAEDEPTEADVAANYASRLEEFREPDRLDLTHVYLSADRRADRAAADAAAIKMRLQQSETAPAEAISLGDPFPLGHELRARSLRDLKRDFGAAFGTAVLAAEPERWSDPIASAYGLHLVWISRIEPGEVPEIDRVAKRIRSELERAERDRKLEARLVRERSRYEIQVSPISEAS